MMYHCLHLGDDSVFTVMAETNHLRWMIRQLQPGSIFLDVGASIGQMTIPVALQRQDVSIYAFEPAKRARRLLLATFVAVLALIALPREGVAQTVARCGKGWLELIDGYPVLHLKGTPYEMGYGPFIKFDHDFIGRQALEKIAARPHRKKVTFAWNPDDVIKVWRSMLDQGEPYKYIDLPLSNYTSASYDKVLLGGKQVGLNMFTGYSYNERSMLSLGIVDPDVALGTEVKILWGEEGGGTKKPTVERHKQIEIRAIVSPAPYSKQAQTSYHEGWRSKAPV